jgi:hypothetical protein
MDGGWASFCERAKAEFDKAAPLITQRLKVRGCSRAPSSRFALLFLCALSRCHSLSWPESLPRARGTAGVAGQLTTTRAVECWEEPYGLSCLE